jgi:phage tail sheath protein FI
VPANGHTAGLSARSDVLRDAWYSPAGFSRGQYLGVTKLAFNPSQSSRDDLYRARVNPVVTFAGQGTVLFGDKTALTSPSAFDRINVRRLFIVLEKAIATAAKAQLFEFNDAFTRAQFRSSVEPFLRDVKNRNGVIDYSVVCDETNNTDTVIDRNEFVCSIFVKPARSINYITLNFVAARSGVQFEEIYGAI